jgi:DNA topoisomerase I
MVNLLIVESPGKIKTLRAILGSGWDVQASLGHVAQLASDGPSRLGFDLKENTVECRYELSERGKEVVAKLKGAARRADRVYLATDPDREGEAISWHLARELGLRNADRITFSAITQAAVQAALKSPRKVDMPLVDAQRARQCLDKLVGYSVSPLLWRALPNSKSAGRVQSAALHILCEREREIKAFVSVNFWQVWVDYEGLRAYYCPTSTEAADSAQTVDDAGGIDEAIAGRVLSQAEADGLVAIARNNPHRVISVKTKVTPKSGPAPFITSSLQQVAGARLGWTPEFTMEVAQKLYEGVDINGSTVGLITYMRTDSVELAPTFVDEARDWFSQFDPKYLAAKVTARRNKDSAQAAHEAIRPTHVELTPKKVRSQLTAEQAQLYEVIWRRTMGSLAAAAQLSKTRILTQSGSVQWEAKGMNVVFDGYTRYWNDLAGESLLPNLEDGDALTLLQAGADKRKTTPPPRYSEPKLVQQMERRGIGRPSTYASTVKTLKQRFYVEVQGKVLVPTEMGLNTDALLMEHISELVDSQFTADMEAELGKIADGKKQWQPWLTQWNRDFLVPSLSQAFKRLPAPAPGAASTTEGGKRFKPLEKSRTPCPVCKTMMGKIPTQKSKKGHILKCEKCSDVVMYWSDKDKKWFQPTNRTTR